MNIVAPQVPGKLKNNLVKGSKILRILKLNPDFTTNDDSTKNGKTDGISISEQNSSPIFIPLIEALLRNINAKEKKTINTINQKKLKICLLETFKENPLF
jgi:hypothetical protein